MVKRVREFNLSLLRKWCWRLREEKSYLWYKVLTAKHDEEGGTIGNGGRIASMWWSNVLSNKGGAEERVDSWFTDHLKYNVTSV